VLAAQDEVATLPRVIAMRELDVKIGGNEIDRLRRGGIGWDNSQSRADCYGAIFRKRLLRA